MFLYASTVEAAESDEWPQGRHHGVIADAAILFGPYLRLLGAAAADDQRTIFTYIMTYVAWMDQVSPTS